MIRCLNKLSSLKLTPKMMGSGECRFLLGNLFTFSDVKFITNPKTSEILYILTADRDEKIRVPNYPSTFSIKRYCFGHKALIRRLITVDDKQLISIDHSGDAYLWNLGKICNLSDDMTLEPDKIVRLDERQLVKRVRTGPRYTIKASSDSVPIKVAALSSSCVESAHINSSLTV